MKRRRWRPFFTMNFVRGSDRQQRQFLPECTEDYVGADNPVRFIDAFVESLDLRALGFQWPRENSQNRGRPAYNPGDLLKLYLYGYLHQVRSSRRLEAECQRNLEVIWLLGRLQPDYKSIAEFGRMHSQAVTEAGAELVRLARSGGLVKGDTVAGGGSKF